MKQPRVVALVRPLKQLPQAAVHRRAVEQALERPIGLDPAVLANAEEDRSVNGPLHRDVQVARRDLRVAKGEVAGEQVAPGLDLRQEGSVDFGRAFLHLAAGKEPLQRAAVDRLRRQQRTKLVPAVQVFLVGEVENSRGRRLVVPGRTDAAVVDRELLEIRENAHRQLGRPGVSP